MSRLRLLSLSLLALIAAGSTPLLAQQPPQPVESAPTVAAQPQQGSFYFSDRFGFRMLSPRGYTIVPGTIPPAPNPPVAAQVLEIWPQAAYLNRASLPEQPPIITLTVYDNVRRLPLARFKSELSRKDDRPITVAGRPGIAYTATGLYESDQVLFSGPNNRYVFRLNVGYLDRKDEIRRVFQQMVSSFKFDVLPGHTPKRPRLNYRTLQQLLQVRDWQAADQETRALIQRLAGKGDLLYSSKTVVAQLPCADLNRVDQLWSQASDGQFGYTAQQRLWQKTASLKDAKARVNQLGQALGWRSTQPLPANPLRQELGNSLWRLDTDLNWSGKITGGHYPWPGIPSQVLSDLLNERSLGCGSCTIDAIYLANDRYYDYLPALFARVEQCRR